MTNEEMESFERFLRESFENVGSRELRLSDEEKEYIVKAYPKAALKVMDYPEHMDGKAWYEVTLV